MRLSKKSEYALRALIDLTHHYAGGPVRREEIARRQNIPVVFLEQILLTLKAAGLVESRRGASGGYYLIKPPRAITLGRVIRLLDGPLAPIGCVSRTAYEKCRDCPYSKQPRCPIRGVMLDVRNAVSKILDNFTVEKFSRRGPSRNGRNGHRRP